jgi:GH24 family phage-related lysozyme (muramidase)
MEIHLLMIQGTLALSMGLIEKFEGIEEHAYLDSVGNTTICAGLTRYPDGAPVRSGDVCSKPVCKAYLKGMVENEYIPRLKTIPGWDRLGQCRQSVLISFAWNMGPNFYEAKGFETISRVLRDGAKNPETYDEMPAALSLYSMANGTRLEGLVKRRAMEAEIWKGESDGVRNLDCMHDTFLKKAPLPSEWLSEVALRPFKTGETIRVVATDEIPADSHEWVVMEGSGERWAIYKPHWWVRPDHQIEEFDPQKVEIDWDNFDALVSKYLTVGEVLQNDARRKPERGSTEEKALIALGKEFDAIREAWGGPLGITSGYRPEPINRDVGGRAGSFHAKGMALDVYPVGESCAAFYKWIARRWSGGLGEGCARGFVHIDTRDNGQFSARGGLSPCCVWSY